MDARKIDIEYNGNGYKMVCIHFDMELCFKNYRF